MCDTTLTKAAKMQGKVEGLGEAKKSLGCISFCPLHSVHQVRMAVVKHPSFRDPKMYGCRVQEEPVYREIEASKTGEGGGYVAEAELRSQEHRAGRPKKSKKKK